ARHLQPLTEVEARHLRSDSQVDGHAVDDKRRKQKADAELLELDRRGVVLLCDRERELASRQELGLFAALCDQIRLRQRPQEGTLGQRLNESGVVPLATRQEKATSTLRGREEEIGRRTPDRAPARRHRSQRAERWEEGNPGKRATLQHRTQRPDTKA